MQHNIVLFPLICESNKSRWLRIYSSIGFIFLMVWPIMPGDSQAAEMKENTFSITFFFLLQTAPGHRTPSSHRDPNIVAL